MFSLYFCDYVVVRSLTTIQEATGKRFQSFTGQLPRQSTRQRRQSKPQFSNWTYPDQRHYTDCQLASILNGVAKEAKEASETSVCAVSCRFHISTLSFYLSFDSLTFRLIYIHQIVGRNGGCVRACARACACACACLCVFFFSFSLQS